MMSIDHTLFYNTFAEEQVLSELLRDPEVRACVEPVLSPPTMKPRNLIRIFGLARPKWQFALAAILLVLIISLLVIKHFTGRAPSVPQPITLLLVPGQRGSESGATLRLPPGSHVVVLTAEINGELSRTYSAVLDGFGRGEINFERLRSTPGPRKSVALRLNSNLLTPGDYTLTLYASDDESRSSPVAGYFFSVVSNSH